MTNPSNPIRLHSVGTPPRATGVGVERDRDIYRSDHKPQKPTVCPQCRAAFNSGHWSWMPPPVGAREELCPACRRIRDEFPAGYVTIEGDFFREHRDELIRLINHRAERAKAEHPLQRIMAIKDTENGALVTTTDMHLARGIAETLHHTHRGELKLHYKETQSLLKAHWKR